jgi:hypothetical protein
MKKKKMTKAEEIAHEEKWVALLQRALASKSFKERDPEEYAKYKLKYDKAKFRLKILKGK